MWRDRKRMYLKHASTNCLTSFIIGQFFDVVLLIILTTPQLSVIKRMQWLAKYFPNISMARTNGYNFRRVISAEVKCLCYEPATHFFPNTTAKPNSLDTPAYNVIV
ncbi:hypothetical protein NP493_111g02001 [Ridgeia piscesae]|uniref:Uncharacterized protein n=1 Tax=Ridgeia piscesae TaxID=27915 RepID=A0AAD9P6W0_RIDPI|nr:hypothetical protein NP493_111g02001 [Ridgeia piscesae]